MPELPEVEVVRRGLAEQLTGARLRAVRVLHPRAARRHPGGGEFLVAALAERDIREVRRRGKYLWLVLDNEEAVVMHLGMSGQFRIGEAGLPGNPNHLRIEADLADGRTLQFFDQRTFGGWEFAPLAEVDGELVPVPVAHIARDPFDPRFDPAATARRIRAKRSAIKRVLLDQTVLSGVGNIYADESLWRARLHGERVAAELGQRKAVALLDAVAAVVHESITEGGTSFDSLYVNVNGESGQFSDWLAVYGQEGKPCRRCGRAIRREAFMNRSSHYCPSCQRL
ncbi:MAG: bifunctional DNA-formamidopyrimidine glycosylase/DNA-(apurinic or apyrimidinic site) lyase [Segniliparus sp.]|uniref:bifunctional DNA-formamidopyrimidine glycosylase/DNA-(apurinic or apyrimidinic site) lyase n=1 Tax=Segniliparus sp. TaxID=2804064 RepID=UPI003F2F1477